MKAERWRQVDELFAAALERAPGERAAFLDAACGADADLRREVEALLRSDERAEDFIETNVFGVAAAVMGARAEAPSATSAAADTIRQERGSQPTFDPSSIDDARFVPGDVLAGRYRIVGPLGRGGMGEVYRADDLKLRQPVALKFLPASLSADAAALARFYQEVSVARQISHRHVCRVYDIGEAEGLHFISMEFVRGEELASLLKRIGRLPVDKAVETARQLCAGLHAVHERGVLHRDLKPANVMIDERGDVRITDFGIAALAEQVRGPEAFAGTPAYMSPEQLAGHELSARSDIYSLGLVLYELFTGRKAFEAASLPELIRLRQSDTTPTSPSSLVQDIDPLVERVIFRCLEKEPGQRPVSALQVAAALPGGDPLAAALAAGETPSPEMVAAAPKEGGLRPAVAVALLVAALASLVLALTLTREVLAIRRVPLEKPPEVLAERARQVVRAAGLHATPADTAYGFETDIEYYRHVTANDTSRSRWDGLKTGQPALLYFWYRQSPQPLEPRTDIEVTTTDPPPQLFSGMAGVRLDTEGRLLELQIVPPELDEPAATDAAPDWPAMFREAGLDITRFTPTEPRWAPHVYADGRAAWEGVFPLQTETPLRVEAASYRGRPVEFKLVEPWRKPYRMEPYLIEPGLQRLLVFISALFVTMVLAGVWLARRNFRLGRGDRRGAFKLALFALAANLAGNLVGASHVPTFQGEVRILSLVFAWSLFYAALLWLLYIALEPYVRRRSPHRLISWTRLLAGDWRDPLVGRDVLVAVLLGIWMNLFIWLAEVTARRFGIAPDLQGIRLETLLGVRGIAPVFVGTQAVVSLFHGLAFVFLLFLLSLVLRGERRGAVAAWALFVSAFVLAGVPPYGLVFNALLAAAYIFVASRFGLLALTVAQFVFFTIEFYPLTTDFTAWYAGVSIFALSVVVALAAYGFHLSLAGKSLFRGSLLED
ncbi:MAG TPA: serine/threonine-protein kinase [Pyrinomonadaceae bacterium]|nr:serine/threonine-protein kinase [Pyrinomonadaceae bacterium]